jgi:hypothetical protein
MASDWVPDLCHDVRSSHESSGKNPGSGKPIQHHPLRSSGNPQAQHLEQWDFRLGFTLFPVGSGENVGGLTLFRLGLLPQLWP